MIRKTPTVLKVVLQLFGSTQSHDTIRGWAMWLVPIVCLSVSLSSDAQTSAPPRESIASADQYSVSNSGIVNFTIPIEVPLGTGGLTPSIALSYSSASGHGMAGEGWSVTGLDTIQRSTRDGTPQYNGSDVFEWRGEELILDSSTNVYHTQRESFHKIVNNGGFAAGSSWTVTAPDGTEFYYGSTKAEVSSPNSAETSRIKATADLSPAVRVWALREVVDPNGNAYQVEYLEDLGQYYPKMITYNTNLTTQRTIELDWVDRPDEGSSFQFGAGITSGKRLNWIEVKADGNPIRTYQLTYFPYAQSSAGHSRLEKVQEFGTSGTSGVGLPPYTFTYNDEPSTQFKFGTQKTWTINNGFEGLALYEINGFHTTSSVMDINGDGLADLVSKRPSSLPDHLDLKVALNDGNGFFNGTGWSNIPEGGHALRSRRGTDPPALIVSGEEFSTVHDVLDMNGDGLPDSVFRKDDSDPLDGVADGDVIIRFGDGTSGFIGVNNWGDPSVRYLRETISSDGDTRADLIDMNRDGLPDHVDFVSSQVSVRVNTGIPEDNSTTPATGGFAAPVLKGSLDSGIHFLRAGSLDGSTQTDLIDMNGDGLVDVVYRDPTTFEFKVQVNRGNIVNSSNIFFGGSPWGTGWTATPQNANIRDVVNNRPVTNLIDMNGDGFPDLVERIGNGTFKVRFNTGGPFDALNNTNGFLATIHDWGSGFNNNGDTEFSEDLSGQNAAGHTTFSIIDMNGDGLPDCVYYDREENTSKVFVKLNECKAFGLLKTATLPTGGKITYNYESSINVNFPTVNRRPFSHWVVTSIVSNDGLAVNGYTTSYLYKDELWDPSTRESRGFREVTTTDPSLDFTRTTYRQDDFLWGNVELTLRYNKSGVLMSGSKFLYKIDPEPAPNPDPAPNPYPSPAGVKHPRLWRAMRATYDGKPTPVATLEEYAYDQYGNVIKTTRSKLTINTP